MGGSELGSLDFGQYLYGMFFAGAFIMGGYGVVAGINAIKGIKVPLAIATALVGYLWWSGENINIFASFF